MSSWTPRAAAYRAISLARTTGRLALGNGKAGTDAAGVAVSSAEILIGGSEPGAGNLIPGNKSRGVQFINTTAVNDRLQGNFIGLDRTGTNALGNALHGVELLGAAHLTIGGTNTGEGNVIAANGGRASASPRPSVDSGSPPRTR